MAVHGDTKISNFVIHDDRVQLIDLDAMFLVNGDDGRQESDVRRFLDNFTGEVRRDFAAAFARAGLLKDATGLV